MNLLQAGVLWLAAPGKEGSTRRRVFDKVVHHPGLHQRAIAAALEIHRNLAEHHLRHLERAGLVQRRREGGRVRYFPTVVPETDTLVDARHRDALGLLRQARPLQLVAVLLAEGALPMGDLAHRVGLSPGTLTYHVKRLEEADVVMRRQEARQRIVDLVDRDATIAFLLQYEPPADLVAGFEDLWQDVGL